MELFIFLFSNVRQMQKSKYAVKNNSCNARK
jgi:hypothetical protein